MSFFVSSIVDVFMNKITFWIAPVWMIGQPNVWSLLVDFEKIVWNYIDAT